MRTVPMKLHARSRDTVCCARSASRSLTSGAALAQSSYPNKPIRILVGFAPGGPSDIISRVVGAKMGEIMGDAVRHREQDRRRRRDRDPGRRALGARRLHALEHAGRHRRQRIPVEDHQIRVRQGHRRGRAAGRDRQHPGRQSHARHENRGRSRQARQGEARRAAVRDRRPRLGDAPHQRTVQHRLPASRPSRCITAAAATP